MRGERGQALVEAVLAVPVCVICALTIVDCGVIVRDRIAVAQAATRGAEAHLAGLSEVDAARAALPRAMRPGARITVEDDRVVVRAASSSRITRLAGARVMHRSGAAFDVEAAR